MAAEKLEWEDKSTAIPSPLAPTQKFTSGEANDLRDKFNANADLLDAAIFGGYFEKVTFTDADGLIEIPFTEEMHTKFPRPKTTAFMVDGDTETEITGYLTTITKENEIIQSITLDGIFGTGYILLTN